ncbi:MAG: glycoside hydrolase family 97 catalytic domain-containing protein, partial [Massilia sp.]
VVASPDGRVAISIEGDASKFTISRGGETVIAPSPLGLEFDGAAEFGPLTLEKRNDVSVDRRIALVATKAAEARDHYRGATLVFRESSPAARRLFIDVRAYDDGVAFRYRIEGGEAVRLNGERTAFVPAGNPECLVSVADGAHEMAFERKKVSQLSAGVAYDVPVVCNTPSRKTAYAITQANLNGYTGASLLLEGDALRVRLSAVPKRAGPAFVSPAGLTTAWRAVMLGDRTGDLIGSHLVGNLNPAPQGDFSWVKPGKAAWDWWSGPLAGMKPSMASYRRFIDFAAAAGLPYYLIDAGWALGSGPDCWIALPGTDITRAADGIDIAELVRYAAGKGVGLMLWAHWEHVAPRMDEVLDTYARWGIKGVKIDFMNRDDQEMVAFYQRIAQATAKRRLLLDLHSAFVPAGLQRSYPNFITQEGVMGAEWNKMNKKITPEHNLMLPYTRMLAGSMDYTPGGFRNASPASFEVRAEMPQTQTTRGQALAMYVVYDSPLQMVSDDPDAYRDAAGFDFIKRVPTAWDETRFLSGEPGRDIVLARRGGKTWYLGAMTAEDVNGASIHAVPLRFLPPGKYRATMWQDGATPNELVRVEREVTAGDVLKLRLASAGGAAVIVEPLDKKTAMKTAALLPLEKSGKAFEPGAIWPDDKGVHINAHGGGILEHAGRYYWFGEHKIEGGAGNAAHVGVHVYSSRDLTGWRDEGIALAVSTDPSSDIVDGSLIERPKVVYNPKTRKFVMWFHLELKGQGYKAARSGVAVADKVTGPYVYQGSFRPDAGVWPADLPEEQKDPAKSIVARDHAGGQMARDMTLFVDADGGAYQLYASEENHTMHISRLSQDFLRSAGQFGRVLPFGDDEAPAIFKHNGKYFLVTSGLSGWAPNAARSYVADNILGPWTALGNPVRGTLEQARITFGGQSTHALTLKRKGCERQILMFDIWRPKNAIDGRYAWLPVEWEDGKPVVRWRERWTLDDLDALPCDTALAPASRRSTGR